MGKQNHSFPFTGKVDTLTFFQTKDGQHMVRKATRAGGMSSLSPEKYQVARRNMAEFSKGAKAGSLLRFALRKQLANVTDKRLVARVTSKLMEVLKSDAVNERGERNINEGDLSLLNGFDITPQSQLGRILLKTPVITINRATGKIQMTIPSFVPRGTDLRYPMGATHFKVIAAGLELDFENKYENSDIQETGTLPIDRIATGDIVLECTVNAGSQLPLLLVAGLEFLAETNGTILSLDNGAFTALTILQTDKL